MNAPCLSTVRRPNSAEDIDAAVAPLEIGSFDPDEIVPALVAWGDIMADDPILSSVTGFPFLRLWLRDGGLRAILRRDFGDRPEDCAATGSGVGRWYGTDTRSRIGIHPVGIVGCWPAGNVEIQPFLTAACALLGGNGCALRVPQGLTQTVERGLAALRSSDVTQILARRIVGLSIDREDRALHAALAERCDGAMIWGGHDAVMSVRSLPFPPHARISVFGPRFSIGAVTRDAWRSSDNARGLAEKIARDLWPFEQQACSSPQVLYVECGRLEDGSGPDETVEAFVGHLTHAFDRETALHPRPTLTPSLAFSIANARAEWCFEGGGRGAAFPRTPDWTILYGNDVRPPLTRGGRVLTVIGVDTIEKALTGVGRDVQTLGLACENRPREEAIADAAARMGCDRIVPFGRMHLFDTPWDGLPLVSATTRQVRQIFHSNIDREPSR